MPYGQFIVKQFFSPLLISSTVRFALWAICYETILFAVGDKVL